MENLCWTESKADSAIQFCAYDEATDKSGACTYWDKELFVDPKTLPKPAFR